MTTILATPSEGRDPITIGSLMPPEQAAFREQTIAELVEKFPWAREAEEAMPPTPVYHPAPLGPGASVDPALAFRDQFRGAIRRMASYRPDRGVPSC